MINRARFKHYNQQNINNTDTPNTQQQPRKIICFILTCDREYYKQRRQKQKETIQLLQSLNIKIYYILAKMQEDYEIIEKWDNNIDALIVPCIDSYETLTEKMYLAYAYFYEDDIDGILKIDDDTIINNKKPIEYILETNIDYIGHTLSHYKKNFYDKFHWKRKLNQKYLYKMITYIDDNISYFSGPFYFISKNIINKIRHTGLDYLAEDLSVGRIVSSSIFLIKEIPEEYKKYVSWTEDTEDYIKKIKYIYFDDTNNLDNIIINIIKIKQIVSNNKVNYKFIKLNIPDNIYIKMFPYILIDELNISQINNDDIIKLNEIKIQENDLSQNIE